MFSNMCMTRSSVRQEGCKLRCRRAVFYDTVIIWMNRSLPAKSTVLVTFVIYPCIISELFLFWKIVCKLVPRLWTASRKLSLLWLITRQCQSNKLNAKSIERDWTQSKTIKYYPGFALAAADTQAAIKRNWKSIESQFKQTQWNTIKYYPRIQHSIKIWLRYCVLLRTFSKNLGNKISW